MTEAVLFDLDGTLADTAPDLAGTLNRLQAEHGMALTPFATLRPQVSHGVRGMLGVGFGLAPDAPTYPALAQRFLGLYADALCIHTCLFPGMSELLDSLIFRVDETISTERIKAAVERAIAVFMAAYGPTNAAA